MLTRSLLIALLLLHGGAALVRAQNDDARQRQAAAEAYDRGTAAYLGGEYAKAAEWFETAHRMSPAAPALMQAIRSHYRAEQFTRAATLALSLMQEYTDESAASEYAQTILGDLSEQFFRVDVVCDCRLDLDGTLQEFHSFFLAPGTAHRLSAHFDTGQRVEEITGDAGENRTVKFEAPPPPPPTHEVTPPTHEVTPDATKTAATRSAPARDDSDRKPLPPRVTFIGAGVTVALAAGSVISLLDQNAKADEYKTAIGTLDECRNDATCTEANEGDRYNDAQSKLNDGQGAETRTLILWIATSSVAAGTAVVALFLTDWSGDADKSGVAWQLAPTLGGAFAAVTARW